MFTAAFSCSETPASCFLQDPRFLLPASRPPTPRPSWRSQEESGWSLSPSTAATP